MRAVEKRCTQRKAANQNYNYVFGNKSNWLRRNACVCATRAHAGGEYELGAISWETPTKTFILGSELIKVMEQMVQTLSGHNETVSGETNRTWQDSWGGFVRWPEFRQAPGVRPYFSQETDSNFFKKQLTLTVLLPPNVLAEQLLLLMLHQKGFISLAGVFW